MAEVYLPSDGVRDVQLREGWHIVVIGQRRDQSQKTWLNDPGELGRDVPALGLARQDHLSHNQPNHMVSSRHASSMLFTVSPLARAALQLAIAAS